jgi:lycopene cyclase domain-containing protein
MPVYPALSLGTAAAVVALELAVFRSGLFRQPAYWLAMAIVYGFMVPVDGWLTKLSDPIVRYRDGDTSGLRPVWDILAEEFVYAFALLTLVILVWDRAGRTDGRDDPRCEADARADEPDPVDDTRVAR